MAGVMLFEPGSEAFSVHVARKRRAMMGPLLSFIDDLLARHGWLGQSGGYCHG
jgi:hypothetical protein